MDFDSTKKVVISGSDFKVIVRENAYNKFLAEMTSESPSDSTLDFIYGHSGGFLSLEKNTGFIRSRSLITGVKKRDFGGHSSPIVGLFYSKDKKFVISGSYDGVVLVWDVNNGKIKKRLSGFANKITAIAYSSDRSVIAIATEGKILLYDIEKDIFFDTLNGVPEEITMLDFAMNNSIVAYAIKDDQNLYSWQFKSSMRRLFSDFHYGEVSNVFQFLWGLEQDGWEFKKKNRTPRLLPLEGQYFTYNLKYQPLLLPPLSGETKLDQIVRFLEAQCAYKDPQQKADCESKKQ